MERLHAPTRWSPRPGRRSLTEQERTPIAADIRPFANSTIRQISGLDLTCHPGMRKAGPLSLRRVLVLARRCKCRPRGVTRWAGRRTSKAVSHRGRAEMNPQDYAARSAQPEEQIP